MGHEMKRVSGVKRGVNKVGERVQKKVKEQCNEFIVYFTVALENYCYLGAFFCPFYGRLE